MQINCLHHDLVSSQIYFGIYFWICHLADHKPTTICQICGQTPENPCVCYGTSGVRYSRATAGEGISCVYWLAFPHISHTEKWWSPVSDSDRARVSLSLQRGLSRDNILGMVAASNDPFKPVWVVVNSVWPDELLFVPCNKNGRESNMWMRKGSSGCQLQVHIHCFHITGCGRVIAANCAGTISSGRYRYACNCKNSKTVVALTVTTDQMDKM